MRLRAADMRFHVEVLSIPGSLPGSRRAVFALHGGPGPDHTALRSGIDVLREDFQLVLVDQRGHGRSDRSDRMRWNLDPVGTSGAVAACPRTPS